MAFGRKDTPAAGSPGTDMMPAAPAAPSPAEITPAGATVLTEDQLARVISVVQDLPGASDTGYGDLLDKLLSATTFEDLNSPWSGTSGRDLAGRRLLITTVSQRPSSYEGGPQIFLVVESTDTRTGEQVTWTTSALAVIVQLAVCHQRGWLPAIAEITAAAKPTAQGYTPYHLTITAIHAAL